MPSADALESMAAAGNTLPIYLSYFKVSEGVGRAIMEILELAEDDHYSMAAALTDEELEKYIIWYISGQQAYGVRDGEQGAHDLEGPAGPHKFTGWAGAAPTE